MTFVINGPKNSALQSVQLGINEMASAIIVGKNVGSIFSRRDDARIFDALESNFHVRVCNLPPWMQGVSSSFERASLVLGERMRRIKGPVVMSELNIHQLQGLATFVVLCTRFVSSKHDVMEFLSLLLIGGLGNSVDKGQLETQSLPYNFKSLLLSFVQACIDSDADSQQGRLAKQWMAELAAFGECGWRSENFSIRTKQAVINVLAELLGGLSVEEEMAKFGKSSITEPKPEPRGRGIHNTLHLESAYVALSAAANGANVVVECIATAGIRFIPSNRPRNPDTFTLRLWLKQPPPDICGALRFSQSIETTTYMSNGSFTGGFAEEMEFTVFGGALEIAKWTAQKFGYAPELTENPPSETVMALWKAGLDISESYHWRVHEQPSKLYPLRFRLDISSSSETSDPQVLALIKALKIVDTRYSTIARKVANAVHGIYKFDGYQDYISDIPKDAEVVKAMLLVLAAIAVGSLHRLTNALGETQDQYALSLSTLNEREGSLRNLIPSALTGGLSHQALLWAASTLWGGASTATQGSTTVVDSVVGIVAPQCTVILDLIRDPLVFAQKGLGTKLIALCRGSVPMLPRDPHTGFVKTPGRDISSRQILTASELEDKHPEMSTDRPLAGGMVITFEPMLSDPSRGIFCCWFMGNLAFEIDPIGVFLNLLKRPLTGLQPREHERGENRNANEALKYRKISQMGLLSLREFEVQGCCVVFDGLFGNPAWIICAAGCSPIHTIFYRGDPTELDVQEKEDCLQEGDVIIVCDH
ncbi:hypothetical protein B0J14DRAFT_578063 [Halenospora varia]|nr:hypothetical protein B0J14DRAFT_578063 [Halenospora varia]